MESCICLASARITMSAKIVSSTPLITIYPFPLHLAHTTLFLIPFQRVALSTAFNEESPEIDHWVPAGRAVGQLQIGKLFGDVVEKLASDASAAANAQLAQTASSV